MEPFPARPDRPAALDPDCVPDPEQVAAVQDAVLGWFAAHGRDLPWRRTRDPWAILVSEVMLQQIQVARAVPFYLAFLERFPTVADLAAAPLADAIQVWGDLGRYRRVVNLHRTAKLVVERHGGAIPTDIAALRALPGIGPYTAGAVACFAFGQDVTFADTNIRRVLSRVFAGVDVPEGSGATGIDRIAAAVLPKRRGWDWHQGLMDFGAILCTARKPGCDRCPIRDQCRAHPGILESPAAADDGHAGRRPAYRYEGSDRYYRGRVLARLREAYAREGTGAGVPLADLGAGIRDDFAAGDLPWLRSVVDGLAKDGLAVAEERPAYDIDGETGIRVKLPT